MFEVWQSLTKQCTEMSGEYDPLKPFYEPIGRGQEAPSAADWRDDTILQEYMSREIVLESDAEWHRRNEIVSELKRIFLQWVKSVAINSEGMTEDEASDVGGTMLLSGSHKLDIREPKADIDAICVAPNFCTREHFFSTLKARLKANPDVTELNAVETARVPMIGLEFRGVAIDLLFARLSTETVEDGNDSMFWDDKILRNLDDATEITLNGPRVTQLIYELVSRAADIHTFRTLLRCVRKWAKRRGLYGNMFGYLGGINCNILCAFICQLYSKKKYPNARPSFLLKKFFWVYKDRQWSEEPVMLNQIKKNDEGETREVWDKFASVKDPRTMPMITPAYPASNTSYNVSEATLDIMRTEFTRAHEILRGVFCDQPKYTLDKLFEPSDFFIKYNHYLCCNLAGVGDDEISRGELDTDFSLFSLLTLSLLFYFITRTSRFTVLFSSLS